MMQRLTFLAPVRIAAKGPPRFSLTAYTGGKLKLAEFSLPVVVDLASMRSPRQATPILRDHVQEQPIGHATRITIGASEIVAEGLLSATGPHAEEVVAAARNGFQWQASIGADPEAMDVIGAGQTVAVNGQTFEGPVYVARRCRLVEISFVAVGADRDTVVRLAAKSTVKGQNMTFEQWLLGFYSIEEMPELSDEIKEALKKVFKKEHGAAADPLVDDPPASAAAARARIAAINEIATGAEGAVPEIRAMAAEAALDGTTPDQFRERALVALRASRKPGPVPFCANRGGLGGSADHLACGLMIRAGFAKAAEKHFGPALCEQSKPFRTMSLLDMCAAAVRMDGKEAHGKDAVIRAAFSSGTFTNALSSSADKILLEAYMTAPAPWRSFAAVKNAGNFKKQTAIRPSWLRSLQKLPRGSSVAHAEISEEKYEFRIHTYARQLKIDRVDVVNDDLNAFSDILPGFGRAAVRTLNDLVAATVLDNLELDGTTSFWTTARANYQEGAGTALSSASLTDAIELLRKMKDLEGNFIDLEPAVLLIPADLEATARALLESLEVNRTGDNSPMGNVTRGVAALVIDPRLGAGVTDPSDEAASAGSTTAWYLFSAPSNAAVCVAFLEGRDAPVLERFGLDADPDVLAFHFRVYHDFGCALADYRASIKSKGAA